MIKQEENRPHDKGEGILTYLITRYSEEESALSQKEIEILVEIILLHFNRSTDSDEWAYKADELCVENGLDPAIMAVHFDQFPLFLKRWKEEHDREWEGREKAWKRKEEEKRAKIQEAINKLVDIGIREGEEYVFIDNFDPRELSIARRKPEHFRQYVAFYRSDSEGPYAANGKKVNLFVVWRCYCLRNGVKTIQPNYLHNSMEESYLETDTQATNIIEAIDNNFHAELVTEVYDNLTATLDVCRSYKVEEISVRELERKCNEIGHFPIFLALSMIIESAPTEKRIYAHELSCIYEESEEQDISTIDKKAYNSFEGFIKVFANKINRLHIVYKPAYEGVSHKEINDSEGCSFSESFVNYCKWRLVTRSMVKMYENYHQWAYSPNLIEDSDQ